MKLRQLVYLNEVIQQGCNISVAAKALYTSQPGISRQLQDLSAELGVEIFRHQGKRLTGLTEAGIEIAAVAAEVIRDVKRIQAIALAHGTGDRRPLTVVATSHAAAGLVHDAVLRCQTDLPGLQLRVFEEEPTAAVAMLRTGDAHLGVLAESLIKHPDLSYFPLEVWRLILIIPELHPIGELPRITLEDIAAYPCCSYERSARSRQVLDEHFARAGLASPIAFSFGSSGEVIECVTDGVGIGLIAETAFVPARHPSLRSRDLSHLVRALTTDLVLPRDRPLSATLRAFVGVLAPNLDLD